MTQDDIRKGLVGVIADETAVSRVDPERNSLIYRGYPVEELAAACSFEEVAYALWHGELPTRTQLAAFTAQERAARSVEKAVLDVIAATSREAHPMDVLRTAISFYGAAEEARDNAADANALLAKSLRLFARAPILTAAIARHRQGHDPIAPRQDLSFSQNFFHMAFGDLPEEGVVKAFDASMILYAEHGFNASTFTARVIASSLADMHGAVVGAIASLKGPLHGGANEAVMDVLEEVRDPANVDAWLDKALKEKRTIMGFGHRVYKKGDSRVPTMTQALRDVAKLRNGNKLVRLSDDLATAFVARKGIHPNLDYPAGPAYHLMGFETPMFTPLFVIARITGWTAHIMEQRADNRLVRPLSAYTGSAARPTPALADRPSD